MTSKSLIITSIAADDHPVLRTFAAACRERDIRFIVIGDTKSPERFDLEGCDYWSVGRQKDLPFALAEILPYRHYARKNLGYLLAMQQGSERIVETDDDNLPHDSFWQEREPEVDCRYFEDQGWVNVYHYFTPQKVWPRGYPLDELQRPQADLSALPERRVHCPIQQGLADENPDVDAVYRLTYPLPLTFSPGPPLGLGSKSWSPFNSQNTVWFPEAFPLLYLPSFCSFRMTDIWRSFVAQRIAWENDWAVLYHEATVWQERNEHDLMRDFEDEIPGYLQNGRIRRLLEALELAPGVENIPDNLRRCYGVLIREDLIDVKERALLDAWLHDVAAVAGQ
jgi:hypothetical protein